MEEASTFLGYVFHNPSLLEEALTTPACKMSEPGVRDNQRLEFLGDAVLGLLSGDKLYREHPEMEEGELTIRRTRLVSTIALSQAAARISLAPRLKRNRGTRDETLDTHALADAIEAILGAAWLDGGLDAARRIFDALQLEEHIENVRWGGNPKGELLLRAQAMKPHRKVTYTQISKTGESHAPVFRCQASIVGVGQAQGEGRSRKDAEAAAAATLLEMMDERTFAE